MTASVCPRCHGPMSGSDREAYCPPCAGRLLLDSTERVEDGLDGSQPSTPNPHRSFQRLGDYELGAELGRGAMGVVYRARQPRLKREVAVKVILASRFAGEAARKRFLAEAELASQLDHPNIVPIYEVGETPDGPFYAMKLVEGGTLAERMQKAEGRRPNGGSALLHSEFFLLPFIKIARAVHHAHQRGVLHRDLKPGNILIDAQGEPHITDFGLARQLGVESSLTVSGSSLGTPAYMAPEQARGEKGITTAADLWSLGAILFHLLAGRPPFVGETAADVLLQARTQEPPSLRSLNSSVPRDLETICLKCLEKDPARRYTSARALAEDLDRWLNHEPILARPSTALERVTKWAQRRPAIAALTALASVLVIVAITGIAWQWRRAERNARAERASNQQARDQLWHSLLAQARAGRLSGQFGSKRAGLEAITAAARIRPAAELRDEAIAHLALFDVQPDPHPHPLPNGAFCFDADVERYAWVDKSAGLLHLVRLADGVELWRQPLPSGSSESLRFSPLGKHLALSGRGDYCFLDAKTGRERFQLRNVRRARLSPDDATLAVIYMDRVVKFFEAETGAELPSHFALNSTSDNLAWSPDGALLAVGEFKTVTLWDWRRVKRIEEARNDSDFVCLLEWRGEYLAAGDARGRIFLWNSRTKRFRHLIGHQDHVESLTMNGDATVLASKSFDGSTRFWNTATGQQVLSTTAGFASQFSRDGLRIGYTTPDKWGVWQVDAPRGFRIVSTGDQTLELVSTAEVSRDGRWLVTANMPSGLHLVDLNTQRVVRYKSTNQIRVAWFMPDDQTILTSGEKQGLMFWSLELLTNQTGGVEGWLGGPRPVPGADWNRSESLGMSHDGKMAGAKTASREVAVVRLDDTNRVTWLRGASGACRPAFSADHRWVVTASEGGGGPRLWEAETGHFVRLLHEHPGNGGVQFSPDGRALVTSDPSGVRFYDTVTWNVTRHLPAEAATILAGSVAFDPGSRFTAFTSGKTALRLADPRTGEVLATLISPAPRPINELRFSRSGRVLAVATASDAVDLWDMVVIQKELEKIGLGFAR